MKAIKKSKEVLTLNNKSYHSEKEILCTQKCLTSHY